MTILDRYLLRTLFMNYLIALAVMMSLYTVLDLFFNIDEFTEAGEPITTVAANVSSYYAAHCFLYFAQLSGVITLFACLTTLARMRRANELVGVLASGVSLYRLAMPIVAFGVATSILWFVDVEVMIPRVAHRLARSHDDAAGRRARGVWFVNDADSALLSAMEFVPATGRIERLLVLHRDDDGAVVKVTEADAASWETVAGHPAGGFWRLERGIERRRVVHDDGFGPREEVVETPVAIYESPLNPAAIEVRQAQQWLAYSSSGQLDDLVDREPQLGARVRQIKHGRFAAPLVNILLLLLGLPFFLSREPANIVSDSGKCVAVCGLCFLTAFCGDHFVHTATLSALPAWLPLIVFTPVAVVLIDRIRT